MSMEMTQFVASALVLIVAAAVVGVIIYLRDRNANTALKEAIAEVRAHPSDMDRVERMFLAQAETLRDAVRGMVQVSKIVASLTPFEWDDDAADLAEELTDGVLHDEGEASSAPLPGEPEG